MRKKNGYTAIDLLIVIVVFGAITIFGISKVSYALSDDKTELYNLEIKYLETQAKAYGQTQIEELKQSSKTTTVNSLIAEKYVQADDDKGNVLDPRDEKRTLNDKKIKLSYNAETDSVEAKLEV